MNREELTKTFILISSIGTVFIRQIVTYKDGPHTERIKIFIMAIDP